LCHGCQETCEEGEEGEEGEEARKEGSAQVVMAKHGKKGKGGKKVAGKAHRPVAFLEKMHRKMSNNFQKLGRLIKERGGTPAVKWLEENR
jgi:hypothetical protein